MNRVCMLLLSALTATACNGSPTNTSGDKQDFVTIAAAKQQSGVVTAHFDEIVTYSDLELRWLDMQDSRCPTGVNCIRAGEVKVTFEATRKSSKQTSPLEFQLTLYVRQNPTIASVFGYELELLSVNPYPKNNVTPLRVNYVAKIKVTKTVEN